jgi:cytochrome c-type biogenesis protein
MNNLVEIFNNANIVIGILISFLGGIVASFSPCSLSSLPIIIGYISKTKDNKNSFKYSIIFALGTTVTFVALGIISVFIGNRINIYNKFINIILGVVLILVVLNLFGVIGSEKKVCKLPKLRKNLFFAFILGILGGIISSPCSAPILIAILAYTSVQKNLLLGILFMLAYSIGSSIIILLAGSSFGIIEKIESNEKYKKIGKTLKIIFGIILLILAMYFLYEGF